MALASFDRLNRDFRSDRYVFDPRHDEQDPARCSKIRFDVPNSARVWNYWAGGRTNYLRDRALGDAVIKVYPEIVTLAKESRRFLIRAVRYLASEAGIRQFLDLGAGLPAMQSTHQVAQSVASDCRTVYVDNDPVAMVYARAELSSPMSACVEADIRQPSHVIAEAKRLLDFDQPVAVLFVGVLGYIRELEEMLSLVARTMKHVPSGSYLVLSDSTDTSEATRNAAAKYVQSGADPYILRGPEQLEQAFIGLELVEPGLVPVNQWRPDDEAGGDMRVDCYGAVARKP